ncbi:MAG: hypothetical protein Kow0081_4370 [Candidatus Dojkabacteria bacterium]
MAELKTKKNSRDVMEFINSIDNAQRLEVAKKLLEIFKEATGMNPKMWGTSIIGFGEYHYKSDRSKQEGDWPLKGFSPRKQSMTIYIMPGCDRYKDILSKIGKHKSGVSCLYVNKLSDIDKKILKDLTKKSVKVMQKNLRDKNHVRNEYLI